MPLFQPLFLSLTCLFQAADEVILDPKYERPAHNWQASIGVQRQIGETTGVELDYVYNKANHEMFTLDNINMTYNPATGVNYPFTNTSTRANPLWGTITADVDVDLGRSETQELRTSCTKRFAHHWQASGTYSLRYMWDAEPLPFSGTEPVTFTVAPASGR